LSRYSNEIVFALHICFALLAGGLIAIDMVAAEAFLTQRYAPPLMVANP
jgi:hypothetical protein